MTTSGETGLTLRGVAPSTEDAIYDAEWTAKFMKPLVMMFRPDDVVAVTVHRRSGDFRYERVDLSCGEAR